MGYSYQNFKEGMVLTHTHLINIEDGIMSAQQGGVEDIYASTYGILPGEVDANKMKELLTIASTNNKTIRFNDGEYVFSETIAVPSNVSLVGNTKTVFKAKSSTTPSVLMTINNADNVFISHIILDGGLRERPQEEGVQIGMSVNSSRSVNIENTEFVGWSKQGLYAKQMSSYGNVVDGKFFKQFQISNCRWYFNYCGTYFDYRCEYSQLCNCLWGENYIGTTNCGGNNAYVGCQWNANQIGFKMDNSGSNPAHGGCNGCTFNHNYGDAIQVNDCVNGWTFEGCQVFYGSIRLNNCKGVVFNGNIWGSCKYISTYPGNFNQNLIVNTYFLTASSTILASNDGSTFVYCCLPDYLPEEAKEIVDKAIIDDTSYNMLLHTAEGTSPGAENCYFASMSTPIEANTEMSNLYLIMKNAVSTSRVTNVNVWVVNAETNTVIEQIVTGEEFDVIYSKVLEKYVININLVKTIYEHPIYFIVQSNRTNNVGIAYSSQSSNEYMGTVAPNIGDIIASNTKYCAEVAVLKKS